MKQIFKTTQAIILIILCSMTLVASETPKEKLLERLSRMKYMKSYSDLTAQEKKKIDSRYSKRERIYLLATKAGMQNTDKYKEYMKIAGEEYAMRLFLQDHKSNIVINEKDIQNYYDKHIQDYRRVHAYTIVRKDKKDLEEYLKILQSTTPQKLEQVFTDLAKKYSQHPRKAKGGDLGFIAYRTMVRPFGEKAFALKENSYTKKPFKTTLGWHLVYVKEQKTISLKKVKKSIKNILISKKYKEWFRSL